MDWNITNSKYGCDLIFWSQSDAHVRIDYIIDDDGTETILASKDCDIRYISETTGIQIKCDITEDNAILGDNPKSGKNGDLIFRITHISGTNPVEILFDGGPGTIGNTSISVSHDR
ncbi:MAG: hypothetical protein HQ528_02795 [Candidatus Marinimicrobia bacterium]|nr:hypothetical protein [Candidatus Neomarinimicrobiota bacterium]